MTDHTGNIEEITLADMNLQIDIDKLITDDLPNRQYSLAIWLVQVNFRKIMTMIGETEKKYYKERALAQAKFFAIQQLPKFIDASSGALMLLINEAQATGWHTTDYFGYSNVEDLLSNIWEEAEEGSSVKSDYSFIVEKLLPAAKQMDIKPGELLVASIQAKKLRQIVPTARTVLDSEMPPEKKKESIEWLIGMVADKNFSVREVARQVNTYRGKYTPIPSSLEGNLFIVPGGKSWIVIECADKIEERAITQVLGSRVNIQLADLTLLFAQVASMLKVNRELTLGDTKFAKMLRNLEEVK